MWPIIAGFVVAIVLLLIIYVAMQPAEFRIRAPPECRPHRPPYSSR